MHDSHLIIRTNFRNVRSHPDELKRCPSDPGRNSPNVRSSENCLLRADIRGRKCAFVLGLHLSRVSKYSGCLSRSSDCMFRTLLSQTPTGGVRSLQLKFSSPGLLPQVFQHPCVQGAVSQRHCHSRISPTRFFVSPCPTPRLASMFHVVSNSSTS